MILNIKTRFILTLLISLLLDLIWTFSVMTSHLILFKLTPLTLINN